MDTNFVFGVPAGCLMDTMFVFGVPAGCMVDTTFVFGVPAGCLMDTMFVFGVPAGCLMDTMFVFGVPAGHQLDKEQNSLIRLALGLMCQALCQQRLVLLTGCMPLSGYNTGSHSLSPCPADWVPASIRL